MSAAGGRIRDMRTCMRTLADLVLPDGCAGCGGAGDQRLWSGVCAACVTRLVALRPHSVRPDPAPAMLPPCVALGEYDSVLGELVLAYKDRGRHRLARPLGRLLAQVVARVAPEAVLLVPIPDTAAAARARHGDHLLRLARPAVAALRRTGRTVALARPLRARPRADSAGLGRAQRAANAAQAFGPRPARAAGARAWVARTGAAVVLVDDVLTTGATLATAAARLADVGLPATGAAVLAATRRHHPVTGRQNKPPQGAEG